MWIFQCFASYSRYSFSADDNKDDDDDDEDDDDDDDEHSMIFNEKGTFWMDVMTHSQ